MSGMLSKTLLLRKVKKENGVPIIGLKYHL